MKNHQITCKHLDPRDGRFGSHGNKLNGGRPRPLPPSVSIRKVPAESVPYGDSISRNGSTVWAVYNEGALIAVAATADEARAKYRDWDMRRRLSAEGEQEKS